MRRQLVSSRIWFTHWRFLCSQNHILLYICVWFPVERDTETSKRASYSCMVLKPGEPNQFLQRSYFVQKSWLSCASYLSFEQRGFSHDKDTIHAEKCAEICDFCMAASTFLTGHGIKARTHAHAEITNFLSRCTIRTWKALSLMLPRPWWCTLLGNVWFPNWAWDLAIVIVQHGDLWHRTTADRWDGAKWYTRCYSDQHLHLAEIYSSCVSIVVLILNGELWMAGK